MARIVIVGGGIAGLSAGYDLVRDGRHDVTLFESSDRLGGKIFTHHLPGMTVEAGPDSIFTAKPWAVDLMTELGLEGEFEEPIGGGFSMLVGGELHPVPRALAGLIPSAEALESVDFFSASDRERILAEASVAAGSGEDEPVASFFRRRFGDRFSAVLAEPLLAGIHAGDASKLSMKALFPAYLGLEQRNGSLSRVSSGGSSSGRRAGFLTLRGGLGLFVDALVSRLSGVDVRLGHPVSGLSFEKGLACVDGVEADAVLLCVPAFVAGKLVAGFAPEASELLGRIRHVSTAIVTFAYRLPCFEREPTGNGFLIPADEQTDITGCTFSSLKWAERAPSDVLLIRAFMGRDGGLDTEAFSDDELIGKAQGQIALLLGATEGPLWSRIDRMPFALPQYELGHLALMDQIEAALGDAPVKLVGGSYRGTGVPDCVRQGREAARRVLEQFG